MCFVAIIKTGGDEVLRKNVLVMIGCMFILGLFLPQRAYAGGWQYNYRTLTVVNKSGGRIYRENGTYIRTLAYNTDWSYDTNSYSYKYVNGSYSCKVGNNEYLKMSDVSTYSPINSILTIGGARASVVNSKLQHVKFLNPGTKWATYGRMTYGNSTKTYLNLGGDQFVSVSAGR